MLAHIQAHGELSESEVVSELSSLLMFGHDCAHTLGGGTKGGQQFGRFELIHREAFASYAEARVREKFLKSGQGRKWLDAQFGHPQEQSKVDLRGAEPSVRR